VPRRPPSPTPKHSLPFIAGILGVVLGVAIVGSTFTTLGPGNRLYWQTTVTVPAGANATHPYEVAFQGATFSMWWPPAPPGNSPSTGLTGIEIRVTEPTGALDSTSTGCGSCGSGPQSWYSPDGDVGISFTDGSFGTDNLLVSV
jgi:hypothetical protein